MGYLQVPGAREHTFSFRIGDDAIALGKHLRKTLQIAYQTQIEPQKQKHLTIAIIGAGPSGVELASTLADLPPTWYAAGGQPNRAKYSGAAEGRRNSCRCRQ